MSSFLKYDFWKLNPMLRGCRKESSGPERRALRPESNCGRRRPANAGGSKKTSGEGKEEPTVAVLHAFGRDQANPKARPDCGLAFSDCLSLEPERLAVLIWA